MIVDEELARAGAPPKPSLGYLIQGISHHGSESIKDRFLPGLINGRDRWCQGFSEPDAGSDLASLRTTATLDGDEYVIDGHKIWTSYSDVAEWCIVLARTDPDVPKHKGLSAFAVPMHQPGIEQRPLKMINGITTEFGQVAFDGARVPADEHDRRAGRGLAAGDDRSSATSASRPSSASRRATSKAVQDLEATARQDPGGRVGRARRPARVGVRAGRDAAHPHGTPPVGAIRRRGPRVRRVDRQAADDVGRADASATRRCRSVSPTRSPAAAPTSSTSTCTAVRRA